MGKRAYSIEDLVEEVENELQEGEESADTEPSPVIPLFKSTEKKPHGLKETTEEREEDYSAPVVTKESIIASLSQKLFSLVLVEKNFEALVQTALNEFTECFQAKYSCILEFNPEREDFFFRAMVGPEQERLRKIRIPKDKGLLKDFMTDRKGILLKDLKKKRPHNIVPFVIAYLSPSTMMGIPLYVGASFYGVLELIDDNEERAFTEEELAALEVCSKMFSKVLEVRFFSKELLKRTIGRRREE